MSIKKLFLSTLFAAGACMAMNGASAAFDEDAAKKTFKKNDCGKCHAEKKSKKGPSLEEIAGKYKGKADAESKLMEHLKSEPEVELKDGTKEKHKAIEVKDDAEMKNIIQYILGQSKG